MESLSTPTMPHGPVVSKWTFSPQKKKIASALAAVAVLGTAAAVIATNSDVNTDFKSAKTGAGACSGVAYDSYQAGDADKHFAVIKTKFSNVRTYQTLVEGTSRGSVNLIDAGAKAGLGMACGLWLRMGDSGFFDRDLKALVDGIKRNPGTCQQVYVGNEDLVSGLDKATVIARIGATKSALAAANIRVPVGTVQTDASMKDPANGDLAAVCDVIGINVYPYSTGAPISQLTIRFNEVARKYPGKVHLTETGWPSAGNGIATYDNAKKYFMDYQQWKNTEGGECPYYFQFHDATNKPGDEGHFGLSADGYTWKFDVAPTPTTPPPTTTPAPTPAPTTVTPAPTTVTPEPTTTEVTPSPTLDNSTNSSSFNVTESLVNNSTNATEVNVTTINSPDGIENSVPSEGESSSTTGEAATTPVDGSSSSDIKDTKVNTSAQEEESTGTGTYIISILSGMVGVAAVAAVIMFAIRNRRRIDEEKDNDFNTGDFFVDTNRGSELSNWPRSGSVAVL